MFSNSREKFYNRILDYINDNKRTALIVAIIVFLLIISIISLFQLSKKEDPTYTTYNNYSCEKLFGSKQLLTDKTLTFLRAIRVESDINIWNTFIDKISSYNSLLNLVNESNKLIAQVEQNSIDNRIGTISIPKDACYLSIDSIENKALQFNLTPFTQKMEMYRWTKKYKKYLSDKEHSEMNTIIIIDNRSYHLKQSFSQSFFIPVIKSQIIVYDLTSER